MTEGDDRALIARLVATRDSQAFDVLYRKHTPRLYALALRLTGERATAADVTHDTWVRAIERLPAFAERSAFGTWLAGILVNCVREHWRQSRHEVSWDEQDDNHFADAAGELTTAASMVDPILAHARAIDLERAIAQLSPGYRQILLLHDHEGFTHEEISELLGIQPGTSKSQLTRARARVRAQLASPQESPT